MTIGPAPACFECKHLGGFVAAGTACAAFPDGIPVPIFLEGFDHRQPFPGDNGVRWAPAEGVTGYPDLVPVPDLTSSPDD